MVKINMKLLPIKAHYFFFMAAMGPILPQISVLGKQLGISPEIMGYITSVLPIMYVLAKPAFGFVADYFTSLRKFIFVSIIMVMTLSYAGFYFVPEPVQHSIRLSTEFNFTLSEWKLQQCPEEVISHNSQCSSSRRLNCTNQQHSEDIFGSLIPNGNPSNLTTTTFVNDQSFHICTAGKDLVWNSTKDRITCYPDMTSVPDCLYGTFTFWLFVVLLCAGTIGFNVTNCISDAICFDVLGESQEMKYGAQRVWGTIGFGVTALLAGIAVDMSTVDAVKSFTPALIIMLVFSGLDLMSVTKLKLPKLSSSESIFREVGGLLCQRPIAIFLVFATIAGIIDSFIIYYMFWHLEEVAALTGYMKEIKLIEGCVVAAECLCGEIPMFLYSGKILKKIGYVHCLTLCFFTYSLRLALISMIPNPWYLVPIEMVMQGCTYALCYTCIVAYASAVAPPGTSATVQGLVAGMDDGLGFAIGSLIGGQTFKYFGGQRSFQFFAIGALVTAFAHIILRPASKHEQFIPRDGYRVPSEQIKMDDK